MSKNRTELIHRTLRNLGVLPQGQSPSAEEYQSIDELIDPMVAVLKKRTIVDSSTATFLDEHFTSLGHILAANASSEFGQDNNQALWALKERSEMDLRVMQKGKVAS